MKKLLFILTLLNISFFLAAQTPPDAYSPQMVKAFAEDLFQNGFFDEAESEYKRYFFLTDTENIEQECFAGLEAIYRGQKNLDGLLWLRNNFYPQINPPLKETINLLTAGFTFKTRDAAAFEQLSKQIAPELPSYTKAFQTVMPLSSALLANDIPLAKQIIQSAPDSDTVFGPIQLLLGNYKNKKPGAALALSFIIPGSGKAYGGNWGGFITDILTIGGFVFGTVYTGINSQWKDWRPYVFGACGLVTYGVSIYGSYQNILRYNNAQYTKLLKEADEIYEKLY